jgi:S1-C subfamily serine protease
MAKKKARKKKNQDSAYTALQIVLDAHAPKSQRKLDDRSARRIRAQIRSWHLAGEILGYGVGAKQVSGISTRQTALQIHVRRKRPLDLLPTRFRIPEALDWPGLDAPVLLDVIERSPFRLANLTGQERPIFPGLSIGHCISGETGTLGAIVSAFNDSERYVLGAGHVLAASGRAQIGDEIVQPGSLDGGSCPDQTIGTLAAFVDLQSGGGFPNKADAALVKLNDNVANAEEARTFNRIADQGEIGINDVLFRTGCRTGERSVQVLNPSYATTVQYPTASGGQELFGFRDLIQYSDFSLPGDSGGPVVTASGALIGIHIAQNDDGFGLAIPAWSLPTEWKIDIR